jgi:hypothetical protein
MWAEAMDLLAKKVAEMALRLAATNGDALRRDTEALDAIEQLAVQILKEVSNARLSKPSYSPGEIRGMWRAVTVR